MKKFVRDLLDTCKNIIGVSSFPRDHKLFQITDEVNNPLLPHNLRGFFRSFVAKLLYLSKRTRADILTEVAFLTKRVLAPQRDDLYKLERTIKYIRGTLNLPLVLEMNDPVHVNSVI
jgi:hypothetical protein